MSSIDHSELEASYQQIISGYDEPELMWMNGKHLKWLGQETGHPTTHDSNGDEIQDGLCYCVSREGIYPCQP